MLSNFIMIAKRLPGRGDCEFCLIPSPGRFRCLPELPEERCPVRGRDSRQTPLRDRDVWQNADMGDTRDIL